jgi:hypothetical protein
MAEKEATVYIVDMGRSMGERHHGRPMTDLEWAMQYVWDRITATVCDLTLFNARELTITGGYWSKDGYGWRSWTQD